MPCAIIGNMKGVKGDPGRDADPVVGIKSINNTRNEGLHHYYRITLTDDTYFDFVVTDGEDAVVDLTIDTPSQVLAKIKNVDGSGSGLDADLLDGKDSSYFAKAEDIESIIATEHQSLHSDFQIYKSGNTVTLHILPWEVNRDETGLYVDTNLSVPVGWQPQSPVYIANVLPEDVRVRVNAEGKIQFFASPGARNFCGSASWCIY